MIIQFRKVKSVPSFIKSLDKIEEYDKLNIEGEYFYNPSKKMVEIDFLIKGLLKVECCRCAKEFETEIEEKIEVFVSDKIIKSSQDMEETIYEVSDSLIDFKEIVKSELKSLESDYYLCNECKKIDNFEIEF